MTLSEAIRLGAMLKPQGKGGRMDVDTRCALAGAAEACGIAPILLPASRFVDERLTVPYRDLSERFPELEQPVDVPESSATWRATSPDRLYRVIYFLNDSADWTREAIADWVETIERQQAAAAVDPHGGIAELTPVHARTENEFEKTLR